MTKQYLTLTSRRTGNSYSFEINGAIVREITATGTSSCGIALKGEFKATSKGDAVKVYRWYLGLNGRIPTSLTVNTSKVQALSVGMNA